MSRRRQFRAQGNHTNLCNAPLNEQRPTEAPHLAKNLELAANDRFMGLRSPAYPLHQSGRRVTSALRPSWVTLARSTTQAAP
jgi:hypothetical protein